MDPLSLKSLASSGHTSPGHTVTPLKGCVTDVTVWEAGHAGHVRSHEAKCDRVTVAATSVEAAKRALTEAQQRGWNIRLVHGHPELRAPLATLSPALVDRLIEFSAAVAIVLADGGAR
jgi:hypothetical protein